MSRVAQVLIPSALSGLLTLLLLYGTVLGRISALEVKVAQIDSIEARVITLGESVARIEAKLDFLIKAWDNRRKEE